ncbi:hypothetical protein POM88_039827 [Heracleum sosnowskyi]|uniref:Uncharacterized protein n=1 Tax=Heracleum sosnowskyi TaxID=360622 RepID=A0AAD8HC30_9APIA|nr:hypothetical protein POM88_039827 [Heracleum sosnowskyi]
MKPLAHDLIRHDTETILSTSLHEEAKIISTEAGRVTYEERSTEFKILQIRAKLYERLRNLEAKITQKIQTLKLKQKQLDLGQSQRSGKFWREHYIPEYDLVTIEDLEEYLYETYEYFDNQIAKLHKGMHHGSVNLVKERQLFKQIKQTREEAEETRADADPVEDCCRHIRDDVCLDTKKALKDHIKVISREIEKKRNWTYGRIGSDEVAVEKEITILEGKLENIKQMKVEEQRMIRNSTYGRIDSDKAATRKEITILKNKLKYFKQMVEASTPQLKTQEIDSW